MDLKLAKYSSSVRLCVTDFMHSQIKELDPDNASASKSVQRLTPIVEDRREKMKNEMLGTYRPIRSDKAAG